MMETRYAIARPDAGKKQWFGGWIPGSGRKPRWRSAREDARIFEELFHARETAAELEKQGIRVEVRYFHRLIHRESCIWLR